MFAAKMSDLYTYYLLFNENVTLLRLMNLIKIKFKFEK